MTVFDDAFTIVVGSEGGYSSNPLDPGNWTGGKVNSGVCKGTNFGISAAAYPSLDIAKLTLADAKAIYKKYYWDKISGDDLPPPVALVCFDAAINSGWNRAAKWLQAACGIGADGIIGPVTIAAVKKASVVGLVIECNAQRLLFMAGLPTWKTFGLGWTRRVVRLGIAATAFEEQAT